MSRPALEIADIFRDHGPAWRAANAGHVSLDQLKVMSAIEACRTARLGGICRSLRCLPAHAEFSTEAAATGIAPNARARRRANGWPTGKPSCCRCRTSMWSSPCRRRSPGSPGRTRRWSTTCLFKASAETLLTIAADPKHLGARIGITAVLHTWGSAMTHHPHIHMIVPGGGISLDGRRWISRRPDFFLPVRVLSSLFRRLMLEKLAAAHAAGRLAFHGAHAALAQRRAFIRFLAPLRRQRWFVYAKRPFAGPKAVLAYLARYTHRVAISNRRLISADANSVTFKVKDYRVEGPGRYTTMTLATHEFIRRFLMHVLPKGLHRIRHYGLFANGNRAANLARMRELLDVAAPEPEPHDAATPAMPEEQVQPCPCCGGRMRVIEIFQAGVMPRARAAPPAVIRIDTS